MFALSYPSRAGHDAEVSTQGRRASVTILTRPTTCLPQSAQTQLPSEATEAEPLAQRGGWPRRPVHAPPSAECAADSRCSLISSGPSLELSVEGRLSRQRTLLKADMMSNSASMRSVMLLFGLGVDSFHHFSDMPRREQSVILSQDNVNLPQFPIGTTNRSKNHLHC